MKEISKLKPLVALIKAYRGGEWLEASLESICTQCNGAVVILSDTPWKDVKDPIFLPGNCQEPINKFKSRYPNFKLIVNKPKERQNTEEQYQLGMRLIQTNFGNECGVLLLDTDEIWEESDLLTLRKEMTNDQNSLCFRSGIWTYLRSPLWRVSPKEKARPVVGLAYPFMPTGKSRLANINELYAKDKIRDVDCSYHHFGYVRLVPEEITSKLVNSTSQDTVPVANNWKHNVWDKLPSGKNIHPQKGFEKCWEGVEETPIRDLPRVVFTSDALWSGLLWHSKDKLLDLFTQEDSQWRKEIELIDPLKCIVTLVHEDMLVSISRLMSMLGRESIISLGWLIPRLRMSFREIVQLALFTRALPDYCRIVEVGSGLGGSIATMMLASHPNTSLYAVDPYVPYDEDNITLVKNVREGNEEIFYDTVKRTKEITGPVRVNLEKSPSSKAHSKFLPNSLDLLLIDGNHSYRSCLEDLELWWSKLNTNGILLVHDYASRFPGVIRAVKEFESGYNVKFILPIGSTLAYLRKL